MILFKRPFKYALNYIRNIVGKVKPVITGNLHPLLNGEIWKTSPMASLKIQIWSIFKQMFENMVHFQTGVWKCGPFSNKCLNIRSIFKHFLKTIRCIFQKLFENGPYDQTFVWQWTIFGSSYFKVAIGLVFQNLTI